MFSELKTALKTLGYKVYDTDVTESSPKFPYIVVWGDHNRPHVESPLSSKILGVQDRLGVTCAAATAEGARMLHGMVRAILQPNGYPATVAGFVLKLSDHQPPQVDRDETLATSGSHPVYTVDIYDVTR